MEGSGRSNARVNVSKSKIIKEYFDHTSAGKRFENELKIYLLAKKKKLSYIPKLISYNRNKRQLVIKNVGEDLKSYLPKRNVTLEDFLPKINKVYTDLVSNGVYHNDLRTKNILYNKKEDKIYLIDFENSGPKYLDTDHEKLVEKIKNLKVLGDQMTSKRSSKRIKRKRSNKQSKRIKKSIKRRNKRSKSKRRRVNYLNR
jgi:tRNA A-37 threonylcarbamoyl transferase component Bud32